jgi:PAS domain S-box-containing protein
VSPRANEERFRAVVESCSELVSLLDRDGAIFYMSPALDRLLGRPAQGTEGRAFVEGLGCEDGAAFARLLERCLIGGEGTSVCSAGVEPDLVCRHQNGERHTFELTLLNALGDPNLGAVVCTARDVTARGRATAELLAADRITSVGLLAAGVVHEINNPLAAVVASLELASNRLTTVGRGGIPGPIHAAELAEDIRAAREATDRVRQIVRDLKVFSGPEDERRSVVDVESLLDTSARLAGNEIRQRARLRKNYGRVPPVYANQSRLGQVFLNLLVNAAQAILESQPGKSDPIIEICTRVDERGRVLVEIADSGQGIAEELRDRLFAPFLPAQGVRSSTGLGLAVCQRIVHELGGEISFDSTPGGGSVFRVCLPPTGREAAGERKAGTSNRPQRRGRVLVVDDEPTINSAITRTLSAEHDVVAETRAADALARLRAGERFDVIFCDLMMPQVTGMDLHRQLQAELPEQAGRMIFLTGGAYTTAARRFLEEVPNLRIEKPFDTRMLRAIVNDRVA